MRMEKREQRKTRTGRVVSDKMVKTIVVAVERRIKHPLYGRVIKRTSKFYAHDEKRQAKVGDTVRIMEARPLSRLKRWRLVEVVKAAK
jgi:small subunit ribosomal protein S17